MALIPSAEILRGVVALWNQSGLEDDFKALWDPDKDLEDQVAFMWRLGFPDQPLPNCVFEQKRTTTEQLMSGGVTTLRSIRDTMLSFTVQVSDLQRAANDSRSSGEIAAELIEKIMQVYGGHHAIAPSQIPMSDNNLLLVQYVGDDAKRREETGSKNKIDFQGLAWRVQYRVVTDSLVAA